MDNTENDLKERVKYFISCKCESEQWDFKQEWHSKIEDLIKDIICFANTVHDKDCYLVFGVSDDYQIVGMVKSRRKQADIIETINNLHFAGDILPKIEVQTILLEGKELDVLIIKNTNRTPIYLKEQYGKMNPGCIYTRIGDKNTPNNSNAEYYEIEQLWKKRLGLTKPPLEFIYDNLQYRLDWEKSDYDWYYIYKPEYVIHTYWDDNEFEVNRQRDEFYSYSQANEATSFMLLEIIANRTVLENYQIVCLDSGRLSIPVPSWGTIDCSINSLEKNYYKYYVKGSKIYKLLSFMYNPENGEERYAYNNLMRVILLYESEDERKGFESYVECNVNDFMRMLSETNEYDYINTRSENRTRLYIKQLQTGCVLNNMLKKYREEYC